MQIPTILAAALLTAGAMGTARTVDAADAPKAGAASPQFDVHEYRVLGNTVLSNRDIETVLYPLLGERKTLADVEVARGALEKLYHDHGFATVFVDIPDQDVDEQIIRLKVTEGRLHEVRIAGARYFSERRILSALPAVATGSVPNLPDLQQQLSAVNVQTADRAVTPILKAGPLPGTVDLSLKVTDHLPLHGSLEVNNQYTPGTRPLRATASLSYDNLFQHFDRLSAQYQVAPQDTHQVNVIAINYAWGSQLGRVRPSVYFIDSSSNVPAVGTIGVLGAGQIYGARFSFPLSRSLTAAPTLTLGIDYKHFRETIGLASSPAVVTPITYSNLSIAFADSWSTKSLLATVGASANFGPRGLPNDTAEFQNKRFKGRPNYFYVKLESALLLRLPKEFQLQFRVDGQLTGDALITNENYSIAGADGVRGYLEAEVLADKGIKGSLQLQSPDFPWHDIPFGDVFVFYDAGRTSVVDPLPDQPLGTKLASWGGGLHLLPGKPFNASLTWADPLKDGPNTLRGDSRVLFVVRGAF